MQKQLERITFLKIQISVGLFAAAAREEKKQKPAFFKNPPHCLSQSRDDVT